MRTLYENEKNYLLIYVVNLDQNYLVL